MRATRTGISFFAFIAITYFSLNPTRAVGQFVVDCTGNTPGAYATINSVVPLLSDGAIVRITGTCTENVKIAGLDSLWIGTPWGQTMNLEGNLNINNVRNLFLHGMNITNPSGDGINISGLSTVVLDQCTSSNNAGLGLGISSSVVSIQNTGAFSNNGRDGISVSGNSNLGLSPYVGPITISSNIGNGIYLQDGVMQAGGNLIINDNKQNPNASSTDTTTGLGIGLFGHARAVVLGMFAPNVISGNQTGGIAITEGSEISICCAMFLPAGVTVGTIIDGNGPVGVSAGWGSQLTISDGVQISNHPDAGIDVYGHSQVFIAANNQITHNGTGPASTYPTRAGVRVDGNSEAYIRGGQITRNGGPGILALVNSSIDLSGAALSSNSGGPIVCDSSAWLVTDQATLPTPFGRASPCNVPNNFGPRFRAFGPRPPHPDLSRIQADEAKYKKLISSF
jgi:hypothetical protein